MFSFLKKNPLDFKDNVAIVNILSINLVENAFEASASDYEAWSKFDETLSQIPLSRDQIFEASYYFWIFNLSHLYICMVKNCREYGDKKFEPFGELVFSKIYTESKIHFVQYAKRTFETNYFIFVLPSDEEILDNILRLARLPMLNEGGFDFDSKSSIGETYYKYLNVMKFDTDPKMRRAIFKHKINTIEKIMEAYAEALTMMRKNMR